MSSLTTLCAWCSLQVRQKMERVKMIMIENVNQVQSSACMFTVDSSRREMEDVESEHSSCAPYSVQLMERGEKIDLLVMRTDKLQQDALKYEKTAKKVKQVYWWKNFKLWVLLVIGLFFLAFVVSFMVCGIDFSSCVARVGDSAGNELDKLGRWSKSNADKAAAKVSGGIAGGGETTTAPSAATTAPTFTTLAGAS